MTFTPSVGIQVQGHDNNIVLNGNLTVVADSEVTSRIYNEMDGSRENINGLVVSGDGNTVEINGGIHLAGEENTLQDGSTPALKRNGYGDTPVIKIDGHSTLYLNGDSTISGVFPLGLGDIIQLNNRAHLELGRNATFILKDINTFEHYNSDTSQVVLVNSGSQMINNGDVELGNIGFAGLLVKSR